MRVAEGVPVVEAFAQTERLELVGDDHVGLEGDGLRHTVLHRGGVMRDEVLHMVAEPVIEDRRTEDGALGELTEPADPLALGQRGEERGIGHHVDGLVEGADEVLSLGEVDGVLAAHARIDHGQERRGHDDEVDAAQIGGGDQTGEIPHHPAAHGHDAVIATEALLGERAVELTGDLERFARLARGHRHRDDGEARLLEAAPNRGTAGVHDRGIRDERHPTGLTETGHERTEPRRRAIPHTYLVGGIGQVDPQTSDTHSKPLCHSDSPTSFTTSSILLPPVSTMMSADAS